MKIGRKIIAVLLACLMLLSLVACNGGKKSLSIDSVTPDFTVSDETAELSREDAEIIVNSIDESIDTSKLTDKELTELANSLLNGLGDKENNSSVDVNANKDAYDENGAMTKPFDEVYPEMVEKGQVEYSEDTLLVKMSNSKQGKLSSAMKSAGVLELEPVVPLEKETWYQASIEKDADVQTVLKAVRELDEVILAEYNYKIKTAAIDNYQDIDAGFGLENNTHKKDQWYMHHCGIPAGFNYMKYDGGQPNVIVAVIDTGVDVDHEDLAHNIWKNTAEKPGNGIDDDKNGYIDDYYGVNIVAGKGDGDDDNGHGTHVAGIIAARNNHIGTVGIAHKTTVMPIKAAAASGYFLQSDIAKAVLYAYENGAEVINMSFGGSACSIAVQDALAVAYTRCVLVASAGNDGLPNEGIFGIPNYPAALTYVLGVMAVDRTGTETYFTNWDYQLYNGVEYELYAPGYDIMSTLPDDRYGSLSGTSMAAPVVAAMAAILRSEYRDADTYPTKFIYGQLTATSENYATCLDPDLHGAHNLPQIVNLYDALTKLPKPDVGMQDFLFFDSEGLKEDTEGRNNGDGVVDAGETIALGLILRNRWGMSENTYVTLDTKSFAGISDPYVTFLNPTVNYDSVGTYSTQDCGKLYTDELHTGWENPFIVKIAEDCPNDYIVKVNVHLSYKNGLDKDDKTVYTNELEPVSFTFTVRNGVVLPSIIDEDMTLTPDNLYIIPNATIITEGTTVTVRPGTNIQFWSDDPKDPYADTYMAYLLVNGKFLVQGTKENPVSIYPSDLMGKYNVEISEGTTGYISLTYADVTNLGYSGNGNTGTRNTISFADHCTFRLNYGTGIRYRYLSSGVVKDWVTSQIDMGYFATVENSVFYKIGISQSGESFVRLFGNANRCVFADCGIKYGDNTKSSSIQHFTAQNCVFLGNTFVDQTEPNRYKNSSLTIGSVSEIPTDNITVLYREESGTTYIESKKPIRLSLIQELGGYALSINDKDEFDWLRERIYRNTSAFFYLEVVWDPASNKPLWTDGTTIPDFLAPHCLTREACSKYNIFLDSPRNTITFNSNTPSKYYYEIPGKILPTDISFAEYVVDLDMAATYQITPRNNPIQLNTTDFIYESRNEDVVKVNASGLVTPVGKGTADVYVYSEDRAVYNYITFHVGDYVALEDFSVTYEENVVTIGESLTCSVDFAPTNTTRKRVVYTSSDSSVIQVDAVTGAVTGLSAGTATITATCEGIERSITLRSYVKATSLEIQQLVTTMSMDAVPVLPNVDVTDGAETILKWSSTDEEVLTFADNAPVLLKEGTTTLTVTDLISGLSDAILVYVTALKTPAIIDVQLTYEAGYALTDTGRLYKWGQDAPACIMDNVKKFSACVGGHGVLCLLFDGSMVYVYNNETYSFTFEGLSECIVDFSYYFSSYSGKFSETADINVVTESGKVYVWDGLYNEPTIVPIDEKVVAIKSSGYNHGYLTDSGNLYYEHYSWSTPKLIARNVTFFVIESEKTVYISEELGYTYHATENKYYETGQYYDEYDGVYIDPHWYSFDYGTHNYIGIKDGNVSLNLSYTDESLYDLSGMGHITTACGYNVYNLNSGVALFVNNEGFLYGVGKASLLGGAISSGIAYTPVIIPLMQFDETLTVLSSNVTNEGCINEQQLELNLNKPIEKAMVTLYEDGVELSSNVKWHHNQIIITSPLGFVDGAQYSLVISATDTYGATNVHPAEDITIEFTYIAPEIPEESPEESPEEAVVRESVLDESIARILTAEQLIAKLTEIQEKLQYNPAFYSNAVLNRLSTDTTVEHWLRLLAPSTGGAEVPLGGNWWGSTNETAIGLQLVDYADFVTYGQLMYAPYLTEAPEDTFPFVTSVKIFNKHGEEVTTVGNEQITVRITFNRDMDTSIPLLVRFGSAYPFGDYELDGKYVNARTWEGKYKLTTIIEGGIQYFTIENGCSATDDLVLMRDRARFAFEIDTTAAQALIMQGEATDTGIKLTWTQDDFDTLMGYNVYRSTTEDGLYTRVNSSVIPANTMEFFDATVEPGVLYYYNFTVVQTDLSESIPSGKIVIMSKDTMAPDIYHSPVYNAVTGANLIVSATVTDNLNISFARVYYRVKGESTWRIAVMNNLNDKYSAIIVSDYLTVEGLEYYIEAFDGVSYTYKGSTENPYYVTVQESVSRDALGDVNGDGAITNLDALMLLKAINDQLNLTAEQFARADLDGDQSLTAKEALCILQYVSGVIGSVDMRG